jgi:hypothetical protein
LTEKRSFFQERRYVKDLFFIERAICSVYKFLFMDFGLFPKLLYLETYCRIFLDYILSFALPLFSFSNLLNSGTTLLRADRLSFPSPPTLGDPNRVIEHTTRYVDE